MKTFATTACLILSLGVVCGEGEKNQEKQRASAQKELQGKWRIVVFESEGYWLSAYGPIGEYFRSLKVDFTDKRFTIDEKKDSKRAGIPFYWDHFYHIDPDKRPKQIDLHALSFPAKGEGEPKDSGIVSLGIYDLQEDTLVLCIDTREASKRPRGFSNPKGSQHVIMLLKREKDGTEEEKGKRK
jgi:uncharacterized protein (TIGR03067 family)